MSNPLFISIPVKLNSPLWCVDGRPDYTKTKGPQMLGGSLHPIVLKAIFNNKPVNFTDLNILKTKYSSGAHRGEMHGHAEVGKCGCGFADSLASIIKTAKDSKADIIQRLESLGVTGVEQTYDQIENYNEKNITLNGESMVGKVEELGGTIENLEGDHKEQAAFVNLKQGTTLDTNGLNKQGKQAFNLDLWAVVEQSKALGIPSEFAKCASLILYLATEIVLVEKKGKSSLPVYINK